MRELANAVSANAPPTWIEMTEDRVRELCFGELMYDSVDPELSYFEINGAGAAHASRVRADRRSRTPLGRIKSLPIGKGIWDIAKIAIGAGFGWFAKAYFG
jgi:hypothetical protein